MHLLVSIEFDRPLFPTSISSIVPFESLSFTNSNAPGEGIVTSSCSTIVFVVVNSIASSCSDEAYVARKVLARINFK